MADLVEPSVAFRESFLAASREVREESRNQHHNYEASASDFAGFVARLLARADEAKLPPDRVPESVFWLVDGEDFVGRVSLRHRLNERLRLIGGHIGYEIRPSRRRQGYGTEGLRLALGKAREQDLRKVLLTCDIDNVGSRKIIERNGGVLQDAIEVPGEKVAIMRYWIDLG